MKITTIAAFLSFVFLSACGQTKSFALDKVEAARRSDDFVTVKVTTKSNGHLSLEPTDEFCVRAVWSTLAASDGGSSDAGASDAGVSADAGTSEPVVPGTELDAVSACSTVSAGFTVELTSTKAIPKVAVLGVYLAKGSGLGTFADTQRVTLSP